MAYTPHNKRGPDKPKRDWYEKLTLGTAIVGVAIVTVSAGITAWMAVSISRQLGAMRDQQRVMESQQRPWIAIQALPDKYQGLIFLENGDAELVLDFKATNVGQAVAIGGFVEAKMAVEIFAPGADFKILTAQGKFCDGIRADPARVPQYFGFTLFPQESSTQQTRLTISRAEIMAATEKFGKDDSVTPIVFGCADYQFYLSPEHHQTRFAFSVERIYMPSNDLNLPVIVGQTVPADQLIFSRWLFGNGEAD